jgi:hypothetical protein
MLQSRTWDRANTGLVLLNNGITGLPLTADQQFQAGFTCAGVRTAPSPFGPAMTSCPANQFSSIYLQVPVPGKENDDHNPQRIAQSVCSTSRLARTICSVGIATVGACALRSSIWPTRPLCTITFPPLAARTT